LQNRWARAAPAGSGSRQQGADVSGDRCRTRDVAALVVASNLQFVVFKSVALKSAALVNLR